MTGKINTVIMDEHGLLFCVKDICETLQITNTTETLRNIGINNKIKLPVFRGKSTIKQNIYYVNTIGLKYILSKTKSSKVIEIIEDLNLSLDIIFPKEEAHYIRIIETSFDYYKIHKQFTVGKYRVDLYFVDYKLAIEIDEDNHRKRCSILESEREEYIKHELNCKFIRFNPTVPYFNIGTVISQIIKHFREFKEEV
jgi:very-short-patch-repair endonuclease